MITVITEDDRTFPIDVDASIEIENLLALLEDDSSIPVDQQQLLHRGKPLDDPKATLASCGVQNDDLLILRDRRNVASASASTSANAGSRALSEEQAAEQIRQQILSNPQSLAQLRANNPQLADAALNSPSRFLELVRSATQRGGGGGGDYDSGLQDITDEFDIDAQRRIEENIRQQRVMENLEHAMEYSPESFGRVTMLYVDCKVNGTDVKAFVDSGAQATIMSPECAERCGIMRLLDTRFAGIARGVGTAKILGRVHSAQLQLGSTLFLPCAFTIMEGKGVEMLLGLDMLKRYQANIDLAKNALVINDQTIRFLDEHELPAEASAEYEIGEDGKPKPVSSGTTSEGVASANANAAAAKFPGSGQSVGSGSSAAAEGRRMHEHGWSFSHPPQQASAPATQQQRSAPQAPPQQRAQAWPQASLTALTDLGASPQQALELLNAANGNVEVAASLLFQQ